MQEIIDLYVAELTIESKPKGKKARNSVYYRHHRNQVIINKYEIIKLRGWAIGNVRRDRVGKGYLHKGKAHCGCGKCIPKTKTWGWKVSDQVKLSKCLYSLKEYTYANERNEAF